jgi:hypothetical protein
MISAVAIYKNVPADIAINTPWTSLLMVVKNIPKICPKGLIIDKNNIIQIDCFLSIPPETKEIPLINIYFNKKVFLKIIKYPY